MAYCTQADLVIRFGELELIQLTDKDGITGSIDTDRVAGAIADADAEINASLSDGGYTVPLSAPPHILVRYGSDIARYFLYDDARPEVVQAGYDRALKWLESVASGRTVIDGQTRDTDESPSAAQVTARTQVYDSDFVEKYSLL